MNISESDVRRAFYRNSFLLYDNLGISASMSDMPSANDKQEACRALHPRGRWARFLLRLQPKKERRLRAVYIYWSRRVDQERSNYLLDKTMELMNESIKDGTHQG